MSTHTYTNTEQAINYTLDYVNRLTPRPNKNDFNFMMGGQATPFTTLKNIITFYGELKFNWFNPRLQELWQIPFYVPNGMVTLISVQKHGCTYIEGMYQTKGLDIDADIWIDFVNFEDAILNVPLIEFFDYLNKKAFEIDSKLNN